MIKLTDILNEAQSSTERVRKYYKRHPKKVKAYLRKTQDDRVARNRDRRKAEDKHGKAKMKNHDVHHPNGPQNGGARLAKKDHGRDKKNESNMISLKSLVKENIVTETLALVLVNAFFWAIGQAFRSKKVDKRAEVRWLQSLEKNLNFNKFVYFTLLKDKKYQKMEADAKENKSVELSKFIYEKTLVDKWLNSKIADGELEKVFAELYPDKNKSSKDIDLYDEQGNPSGFNINYSEWKKFIKERGRKELVSTLQSGSVKSFIERFAKSKGLK